jgi:hypothetical protein
MKLSLSQPNIRILGTSAVAVSGAADTNENILATITIPAGAMGPNGRLRIQTGWTVTNSANNKVLRVRFSGIGGTIFYGATVTTSASVEDVRSIHNRGVTNSQACFQGGASFGSSSSAYGTSSVDTSVATTVVITGQKATAGETLTLESYLVELILP